MSDLRRIAVVTAHPPGRGPLNEYGLHFVRHLAAKPDVEEVVVLADDLPDDLTYPELPGVRFLTAWRFDSLTTPLRIVRALRQERPDAVVFNAHFASFGAGKVANALALVTPLLARLTGTPSIVLQHNIVETVDLETAGFGANRIVTALYRAIGTVLTWLLLRANLVTVTIPEYVEVLRSKYRARNVVLTPHGSFEDLVPADASVPDGPLQILTFGKFGTYKQVDDLIAAYRLLAGTRGLELVIAGSDSPNSPGYLADVEARLGGDGITFTGYVEEEDVPTLFRSAAVVVFPYTSTTGSSGVLHQAGEYARAVALPNIGDFAEVITEEGFVGEFFEPADVPSMAEAIARLLDDPTHREAQGLRNHAAATGLPLADIVDWYVLHVRRLRGRRRVARGRTDHATAA